MRDRREEKIENELRALCRSGVLLLLALGAGLAAAGSAVAEVDPAGDPPGLDALSWISGSWSGEALGGEVEEIWSEPADGTMVGVFRLRAGGKTQVIEYLMITQEASGPVYRFKHFNSDYSTWEKDTPLLFDRVTIGEGEAIFESSVQDRPKRLIYRRAGDRLTVTVEGYENGELSSFEVPMQRR